MQRENLLLDAAIPAGASTAAALAFRYRDKLQVTVVAKATFAFVEDAAMRRVAPQPIVRAEVGYPAPAKSVRLTTDLVPHLRRADVLFTGHAHAPPGSKVRQLHVRLGLFDGVRSVLDKGLLVRDGVDFDRMPIVYERAHGGFGSLDNPVGVGMREPNVVDPAASQKTAGLGPIAIGWPVRKRLLGGKPIEALAGDLFEIPGDFDWTYYQAAPSDQRVDVLRGDEWLVMDGLHPTLQRLRTRLPGARGLARVHGLAAFGYPEGAPLALRPDMLRIDGDEQLCTLTFRGTFPVPGEEALGAVLVVVGVESPESAGAPSADPGSKEASAGPPVIAWPAPDVLAAAAAERWSRRLATARSAPPPAPDEGSRGAPHGDETLPLPQRDVQEKKVPTLPFVAGASGLAAGTPAAPKRAMFTGTLDLPGPAAPVAVAIAMDAPPAGKPAKPPRAMIDVTLAADGAPPAGAKAVPFVAPAAVSPLAQPSGAKTPNPFTGTLNLPPAAGPPAAGAVLPFAGEDRRAAVASRAALEAPEGPAAVALGSAALGPSSFDDPRPPVAGEAPPVAGAPSPAGSLLPEGPLGADPAGGGAIDLEVYAEVCGALADPLITLAEILHARGIEPRSYEDSGRHVRRMIALETKRGRRGLRDRFDDAYVRGWEATEPNRFGPTHYARLLVAERRGRLHLELADQGLDGALGMRLLRVWARRVGAGGALAEQVHAALAAGGHR
jgi:hypothetical protein